MGRTRALLIVFVLVAAAAAAQDFFRGYGRGYNRVPPRFPKADSYDGAFSFCRGMYTSARREAGGQGWSTDYPDADVNFSIRFSELTKTRVGRQRTGDPNHIVVQLTDEYLFDCPFLLMADVGTMELNADEVQALRAYLLKGGFLWVDDFWGPWAWAAWEENIGRVLPPAEYPIKDLPPEHPIFRSMFEIAKLPQIPSIQFWRVSGGLTSERGAESSEPRIRGISDGHDNLMVLMTHNTDISDAWEREGEDPRYFYSFSPDGYAVAINAVLYGLTH
jgi:Domain of unknown function (DUF4159)